MEERSLRVLEYPLFLEGLKSFASSEVGQALCAALRPSSQIDEIEPGLHEVAETTDLLKEAGEIPLHGLQEIRPLLTEARAEGTFLSPESLLRIKATAAAAEGTGKFLRTPRPFPQRLEKWAEQIPDLRELGRRLDSAVGPRGEILDSASPELRRIRREISLVRSRIRQDLEALWQRDEFRRIFQEEIITLRNERYVVAVKAEFKNAFPGIIHDQSQSRATFFVEPLSTLEENNQLNLLLQDEKEEERRILQDLTTEVRRRTGDLHRTVEVLGHLDLVMAKAKWAGKFRGSIPSLNTRGTWRLLNARHPLLEPNAVPIDLDLKPGQSTLIISGANAGGKTAALKTLGLLTLIAQSGVPIPADDRSEVSVFARVFADIGDEQDLRENLSTFSAWVRSISRILQESDSSSLVLLDEVGGGTDPIEGAALTMALLDGLRARKAKTVVTTHLHLLKAYGALQEDVVNVSVEFDPETLRPNFRLFYGRPGESHALLMAEKWGAPPDLVRKAYGYLGEGERKVSQLVEKLEQNEHDLEKRIQEAEVLKREAEILRRQTEETLIQTRREKNEILSRAREQTETAAREAREGLRDLINDFKARGRTDLHRLGREIEEKERKFSLGTLPPTEREAYPADSADAGSHPSSLEKLKESFALKNGKKRRGAPAGRRGRIDYQIPSAQREINVIGLRVEEALPVVDKGLDEAFLGGLKEMDVIHGAGTGRLRQAIRDHLRDHPLVDSFAPGAPGRGGNGVTVVVISPSPSANPRHSRKSGAEHSNR